ncbi:MAG: C40 family peptidase [Alicyclobacillus sp.]|nr:C40 family peptidase [Alicyclobacillus sp.]
MPLNLGSWLKFLGGSAVTVVSVAALAGTAPAWAANPAKVTVVSNAYLISAPQSGSSHVALEPAGTVLSVLPGSTAYWWHVRDPQGRTGYITTNSKWTSPGSAASTASAANSAALSANTSGIHAVTSAANLPPGVRLDGSIKPLAGLGANTQQKIQAVLQVAESKLGTPYEWGHNEDRGQIGFDCSNFTAYVYHHALGYLMSTASRTQAASVGWTVSRSQMRPGDLLIFDDGKHVGIYAGNNQMIQEGGGLGKVGYLSIAPGSYWSNHLTAVKRLF